MIGVYGLLEQKLFSVVYASHFQIQSNN